MKGFNLNLNRCLAIASLMLLSACAGLAPERRVDLKVAPNWQAPLPHAGSTVSLSQWWQAQGDPVLVELIKAAQEVSPTVSSALYKVEAARSQQVAANALLLPSVSAQSSARRGVALPGANQATRTDASLLTSWELDLTGANRQAAAAGIGRVQSNQAQWHDARVAVAAEVANQYYSLQTCKKQTQLALEDARSTRETDRITELSMRAGFATAASAATAKAAAAQASGRLTSQRAQCDLYVKVLVGMTALKEPELREKVDTRKEADALAPTFSIASMPVQVISQRPDVFSAERDVVYAAAQVGTAMAARYPRLSLEGNITSVRLDDRGSGQDFSLWSFGPLTLNLPLFDASQRKAAVKSAEAAYRDAVLAYQGKVRQAVREVEEALVNLGSIEARRADLQTSSDGFAKALSLTQVRYQQGLASLLELEDARRSALSSQSNLINLKLERQQAWVALYRAAGGGFDAPSIVASNSVTP
jgi:outer membrane protein, multidrug efflux system